MMIQCKMELCECFLCLGKSPDNRKYDFPCASFSDIDPKLSVRASKGNDNKSIKKRSPRNIDQSSLGHLLSFDFCFVDAAYCAFHIRLGEGRSMLS